MRLFPTILVLCVTGLALGGCAESSENSTGSSAAAACRVKYSTNDWDVGFTATVKITNRGTQPIAGWELAFDFPTGQKVTEVWSSKVASRGEHVTLRAEAWNGDIPAGQSVEIGFNGSHTGKNTPPREFTLNGVRCAS